MEEMVGIEPTFAAWDNHLHSVDAYQQVVADDVVAAVLPLDDISISQYPLVADNRSYTQSRYCEIDCHRVEITPFTIVLRAL